MPMLFTQYTIAYNYLPIDMAFTTDLYIALHVHGSVFYKFVMPNIDIDNMDIWLCRTK